MLEPERTQRYLRNGACDEHGSRRGQQGRGCASGPSAAAL